MRATAYVVYGGGLVWGILLMVELTTSQILPPPVTCPIITCLNGGTCDSVTQRCVCATGWDGQDCSESLCESECQHGGNCTALNTCKCTENWTGLTCTSPVCNPECQNGGTCTELNSCYCHSDEWGGKACSRPLCKEGFCKNGGDCLYPDRNCTCQRGWKGDTCEEKIVNAEVLAPCLLLGVTVIAIIVLMIAIVIGKFRKRKPSLETFEVFENTAYRSVNDGKSTSYRPISETDAIYDDPLPKKLIKDTENESIYENTDYNPCEYQYI